MTDNTLKPWYAIATPHEDIRLGRLDESIFAANLWEVVQGDAPPIYLDPEEFLRKTYMTAGMAATLKRVGSALSGGSDSGDRIMSLQTAFGGGKTHTLVALWHLARYADRLRTSPAAASLHEALAGNFPRQVRAVAVFTNQTCDPVQGRRTSSGIHTRTLWGEIAAQLGENTGLPMLYEMVRPNDEARTVPMGIFHEVLRAAAPCLILIDELADYCVGAAGVAVGATTLADQTISFIQQLTEATALVPGAVVVATLPASKAEVASSEKGQEAFITLEKRFQRLGADVKPVADDEIYDVVRTRLFERITPPGQEDYPRIVAAAYHTMYANHANEVPIEAAKPSIRDQIAQAYPFHPELIDALYKRWGSHPDFQRTRGVLRLMASVIGDLWSRRDATTQSQPLIQPCHINWSLDPLNASLTRLWGPAYQAVVAADVYGAGSNARKLDEERGGDYSREKIAQGIAAATLLGSFGGQAERSGYSSKDLKYACSRPTLDWNYTDGAFVELENRCFYMHTASAGNLGKRYWFSTRPTLNRLIVRYRDQFAGQSFDTEIIDVIKAGIERGAGKDATWRPFVNPGIELAEQKSLALIVLPPALASNGDDETLKPVREAVQAISKKCGGKDRSYRNTLVFLAPTTRGLNKLRQAQRELAALKAIKAEFSEQLDQEQKDDLKKRLESAEKTAADALGPAYTVALRVQGSDVEHVTLNNAGATFTEHLGYLWKALVEEEEWILRRVGSVSLRESGLIPNTADASPLRVKDAVEAFLKYTDKPIITGREAVARGLEQACKDRLIGIARGTNPSTFMSRTCGEAITIDPSEDGLWIIPPFTEEPAPPKAIDPNQPTESASVGGTPDSRTTVSASDSTAEAQTAGETFTRKIRKFRISGTVPLESWSDIFRSFVLPTSKMGLKQQKLGINFEMLAGDQSAIDPNDPTFKAMQEAARQLGLHFEEE